MKKKAVRGQGRYTYTYGDLADLTGYKRKTLQNFAWEGRFDPKNFRSVIEWLWSLDRLNIDDW